MVLPFARYPLVRADGVSVDVANNEFKRLYRSGSVEFLRNEKTLTWHANGISLGPMLIVAGSIEAQVNVGLEPSGNTVYLLLSRGGTASVTTGGKEYAVGNGLGAVVAPSQASSISLSSAYESLTIGLDYGALNDTLQALSGMYSAKPLEFDNTFDARTPNGAELFRLVDFIVMTMDQGISPINHPLVLTNLSNAFLAAFLLGHPHNHRNLLEQGVLSPSAHAVKTVEAYLDANADKAITMTELQAVAGVSVRAIQAGFKAKRGCSPMTFLKERRLLLAKGQLEMATPGTHVTGVALACGFGHLGRFSRDYCRRFGEKPSETLERALRKSHGITSRV